MRFVCLVAITLLPYLAHTQNLVQNPGFENHLKPLERLQQATFLSNFEFGQTVQGWESFSAANMSALFSTKYKANKWQSESLGYNFEKCLPHSGHSMIRIWVNPKGGVCGIGNGGNIQSKLISPLNTANIYSVSFWVFIVKSDGTYYFPSFPKNFGIAFSGKKLSSNPDCVPINDTPFSIDSVALGYWRQLNFFIKPTMPLSEIAFGVFYNPYKPYSFPDDDRGFSYYFFIDDIDIHAVANPDSSVLTQAIQYPFIHKKTETLEPKFSYEPPLETAIYFDHDSDSLDYAGKHLLDSLISKMKQRPKSSFQISGHTDNIGKTNESLSKRRAQAVYQYLTAHGHFAKYQFELRGFGSDSAVADNNSEAGRKLNRRVLIRENVNKYPVMLYSQASSFVKNNMPDSAFYCLSQWLKMEPDAMLLIHDPDLSPLHQLDEWKRIEAKVRLKYNRFKSPEMAYKLDNLYFRDQRYRTLSAMYAAAKGYVPKGIDTLDIKSPMRITLDSLDYLETIKYIKSANWPDASVVGARQANAIFYIIIHISDVRKQKEALPYLEAACKKGTVTWDKYAWLFDVIRIKESGLQYYGTQYKADEADPSTYRIAPIENPEEVDKRRAEIGMPPLDKNSFYIMRNR